MYVLYTLAAVLTRLFVHLAQETGQGDLQPHGGENSSSGCKSLARQWDGWTRNGCAVAIQLPDSAHSTFGSGVRLWRSGLHHRGPLPGKTTRPLSTHKDA